MRTCKHCGKEIQVNYADPTSYRRVYCDDKCKQDAQNKRYYERHKAEMIQRVIRNRKER